MSTAPNLGVPNPIGKDEKLFSMQIYLSENTQISKRRVYDLLTCFGDVGGVFGSNFVVATVIYAIFVGPNTDTLHLTKSFFLPDRTTPSNPKTTKDADQVRTWLTRLRTDYRREGFFTLLVTNSILWSLLYSCLKCCKTC